MVDNYSQKDLDRAKAEGQLLSDVSSIKDKVISIEKKLESNYVSHEEFTPIKNLVYGLVGLILTSVVVSLLSLVILKN